MDGFEDFDLFLPNREFDDEELIDNAIFDSFKSNENAQEGNNQASGSRSIPAANLDNESPSATHSVTSTKSNDSISSKGTHKRVKRQRISYAGMNEDQIQEAKKNRRREQIAKASRLSRARRKQEMSELKDENEVLKKEREGHLRRINELQKSVERLRQVGEIDVRAENELLRAQLEQHKRFIACFKHLCDTPLPISTPSEVDAQKFVPASPSPNPRMFESKRSEAFPNTPPGPSSRQMMMKHGANAAHEHFVALLSQSAADNWMEVYIPDEASLPYDDFHIFFKLQTEFGFSAGSIKQRLNVRIDITYEGLDGEGIVEFIWSSLCSTASQKRLYNVENIEIVQLKMTQEEQLLGSNVDEADTKLFYYREKNLPPIMDRDWVVICNKRERNLPVTLLKSPLIKTEPTKKRNSGEMDQRSCTVLALSTTQHGAAPEVPNANRITSFFIQGACIYNERANAKLSVVFSFPGDFHTSAIKGFHDLIEIHPESGQGRLTMKFADVIRELYSMLDEQES